MESPARPLAPTRRIRRDQLLPRHTVQHRRGSRRHRRLHNHAQRLRVSSAKILGIVKHRFTILHTETLLSDLRHNGLEPNSPHPHRRRAIDENAADAKNSQPLNQDNGASPAQATPASTKSATEYAETFNKAVDVAEKVLCFAPLPAGAKRVATRAMPTVKKSAKIAPMVAPTAEPYARKAAAKAKEVAPKVAQAAKTGAKAVAAGAQAGTKTAAGHVRTTAPKLGHAAADKAPRIAGKLKRKNDESREPRPPS